MILCFTLFSISHTLSQNVQKETTSPEAVLDVLDMDKASVFPSFPGGEEKLIQFIKDNLNYPIQSIYNKTSGRVSTRFIIDKDGFIKNPEIIKSLDPYCDKEAIRVLKRMPKWNPGKDKNGNGAAFYYTLPIVFRLAY